MKPRPVCVNGHDTRLNGGRNSWRACRECHNARTKKSYAKDVKKGREQRKVWRDANKERIRANWLKQYGITIAQYEKMLALQGGVCKICGRPPKTVRLAVDHDHKAPHRVRGLLCRTCNHRLLGRGLENPGLHRRAAEYLESSFDGRAL